MGRKSPKTHQRRGLPPPCGIHPAVRGVPASFSFQPLARGGHLDGMAIRWAGPDSLMSGASTPQGLTLVCRCSQRPEAWLPAAGMPHTRARPWKESHRLTERGALPIDLPGHPCDPTGPRAENRRTQGHLVPRGGFHKAGEGPAFGDSFPDFSSGRNRAQRSVPGGGAGFCRGTWRSKFFFLRKRDVSQNVSFVAHPFLLSTAKTNPVCGTSAAFWACKSQPTPPGWSFLRKFFNFGKLRCHFLRYTGLKPSVFPLHPQLFQVEG